MSICFFLTEIPVMTEDRHNNIAMSVLIQYWSLGTANFLFFEAFATFRAITQGIIGGKTWSYIPLGYGAPLLDIGITLYMRGKDYGTDPRAFVGWENDTKMLFFYSMLPTILVTKQSE